MKEYSASATIVASPQAIWAILTDAEHYPDWDPGILRVEGVIVSGEKVTVYTKLSPDRAFPVNVTEFVPHKLMVWTGGMPLGLFKGQRTVTLTPAAAGAAEFQTREVFSGPLLTLIGRMIPDLSESFN